MACPHMEFYVDKTKQDLIRSSEGSCQVCKVPGPNLWACLSASCKSVGCGESKNDHGSKHYEMEKHFVSMNLRSFRIWCYACEKELHLGQFNPIEMKQLRYAKAKKVVPGSACLTQKLPHAKADKQSESPAVAQSPALNFATLPSLTMLEQEAGDVAPEITRGLTGLRNLGNTCYMNAALQCLSNCRQLSLFFMQMGKILDRGQKSKMTTSYVKLLNDLWNKRRFSSVAPSAVHSTLRMINPSFKSYQQQDTQEFLRCFMDRLHEELKFTVAVDEVPLRPASNEAGGDASFTVPTVITPTLPASSNDDGKSMTMSTSSEESFKSCQSMDVDRDESAVEQMEADHEDNPMIARSALSFPQELDQLHASGSPLFRSTSMPSIASSPPLSPPVSRRSPQHFESPRKRTVSMRSSPHPEQLMSAPLNKVIPKKKVYKYKSVISDIFDGEIRSSVQCRTCSSFSHTRETFQDLSLPIPGKDETARLHGFSPTMGVPTGSATPPSGGPCANTDGYQTRVYYLWDWLKSWFWGPEVNLCDCLAAFFSADELKGDNMYSCEKCNKLRNGIKYCRLLKLPEVLCIHLKRFRHEYLTSYSTKISSNVSFPLEGLDLRRYKATDNMSDTNTVYDLSSVIVHHGGAGGGHYTSYCKNPINSHWYEFDDQYVTRVSESTVSEAEAYVLFYSKRDEDARRVRDQVLSLDGNTDPVLMRYYVAVEWMVKFLTFAEPGPIDNRRFLCPHDNLEPSLADRTADTVCCVSEHTWRAMHERFGGGPAVTHLQPCGTCIKEAKMLETRRSNERDMFLKLSESAQELSRAPTFYVSMEWFRKWQNFIHAKEKDPPTEIDNSPIAVVKDGKVSLNRAGDYGEIASDAWRYLQSTYGGGPSIPNTSVLQYPPTDDEEIS